MSTPSPIPLTEMERDQEGVVLEIRGGRRLIHRLESLGLRAGVTLTMVSPPYLRGPVTVRIGNAQVALGHGMAGKVIINIT